MNAAPGTSREWMIPGFLTGLGSAGTAALGVRIRDGVGGTFLARTTLGIIEDVTVGVSAVYRFTFTAPAVEGQFWLVADDGVTIHEEELLVTYSSPGPSTPLGRDLCSLADVLSYVPAYVSNPTTDAKLQQLISAQSDLIYDETQREIVTLGDGDPRVFDVTQYGIVTGKVAIDDLAVLDTVSVIATDGALTSVDLAGLDMLYRYGRQPSEPWEPITMLRFAAWRNAPTLARNQAIQVTGNWGFPQIPGFIREACAGRVILRYVSDVASSGDAFSEAVAGGNLNLAAIFASSRESVERLRQRVLIS